MIGSPHQGFANGSSTAGAVTFFEGAMPDSGFDAALDFDSAPSEGGFEDVLASDTGASGFDGGCVDSGAEGVAFHSAASPKICH